MATVTEEHRLLDGIERDAKKHGIAWAIAYAKCQIRAIATQAAMSGYTTPRGEQIRSVYQSFVDAQEGK